MNSWCVLLGGQWSSWSSWSGCSVSCGCGIRRRTRRCYGGRWCVGSDTDTETCFLGHCGQSRDVSLTVWHV